MKIRIKTSVVTFYDVVTKAVFKKEFFGRYTHKSALAKLQPSNKTKVVDIVSTSTTYAVDDNKLIEFIANNGKEVVTNENKND